MYSKQIIPSPFCMPKRKQTTEQTALPPKPPMSPPMPSPAVTQPRIGAPIFPLLFLSLLLLQEKG